MPGSLLIFGCRKQDGPTKPLANEQRDFNVESVVVDRPASALDGALYPVLDGIGMQVELVGRRFVAGAAVGPLLASGRSVSWSRPGSGRHGCLGLVTRSDMSCRVM